MARKITPAAQRLCEWWNSPDGGVRMTLGESYLDLGDAQDIVDVVINVPETPDHLIGRMAGALRQTLTMMSGNDEQWEKMARQIVARAGLEGEDS